MKIRNITTKAAAAAAFALVVAAPVYAQTPEATSAPSLAAPHSTGFYRSSGGSNTLLVISAAVLIIGLIDDDTTLAVLGGAGVVLSLYDSGQMHYQLNSYGRGADLVKMGPASFGVSPFNAVAPQPFGSPSVYAQLKFKF